MTDIKPNVFLVGVQKAATTSLYDWIAQHPEVCGPASMKDTPFFIDDDLFKKGQSFLNKVYGNSFRDQKIVINGSAHSIYFEHAVRRIKEYNKEAKIILVLRDPVERAISAYNFAKKRNLESDDLITAVKKEPERLRSTDIKILSETTYIDHGKYYEQLDKLYNYFSPENTLVLFYEDIRNIPDETIRSVYEFIKVDHRFKPELKSLNKTGETRLPWVKNMIYNDSKLKQFLLRNFVDKIIPYDLKYRSKIFFLNLITKKNGEPNSEKIDSNTKKILYDFFADDIKKLEDLLEKDLTQWKKY